MNNPLNRQIALYPLLKTLSDLPGVSGAEGPVRDLIAQEVHRYADKMWVDALGNLIVLKKGDSSSTKRVAVMAHMDEVGLVVSGADDKGFLKIKSAGGIIPNILVAQRMKVGPDGIPGIIGYKPVHLQSQEERNKSAKMDEIFVDIGAKTEEEALNKAPLGTAVSFDREMKFAGEPPAVVPEDGGLPETGRLTGKAFDDRVGCLAIIALLRGERLPYDLYAVFTVQEEVGLRGAPTAAWAIQPDMALILESTVADDLPREEDLSPTTRLGEGPAITVSDRASIADPRLLRYFLAKAEETQIPLQIKQPGVGGTDGRAVQLTRAGVPVAILAVPSRYIHSPVSLIDLRDVHNLLRLLEAALPDMPAALQMKR